MIAKHYYEAHVTIDPVPYDERLKRLNQIAAKFGFKVASLLMEKGGERLPSSIDAFMTAHNKDSVILKLRIVGLVTELNLSGFVVRRYKIEDIVMDSRINDELELLGRMIYEDNTMDVMIDGHLQRRRIAFLQYTDKAPIDRLPEFSVAQHIPVLRYGEEVIFFVGSLVPLIINLQKRSAHASQEKY